MQETKPATPAKKGSILAAVLLVAALTVYFAAGLAQRNIVYLLYAILFTGILISSVYYARQMNGNVTFGNVFAEGFKTTAVVIVLSAMCTFLTLKVFFPGLIDSLIEAGKAEMKRQGGSSDTQIKTYFDGMRGFMVPLIIGYIIFFFGITGSIGALAGAAIAKKKPANTIAK